MCVRSGETNGPPDPFEVAMRVGVVLPLVPVIAMIGMSAGAPGGYNISMTCSATFLPIPSLGDRCMRKPGAALTSMIPPPFSDRGSVTLGAITSTPATSRPMIFAILSNRKMFSGVPVCPVDRRTAGRNVRSSFQVQLFADGKTDSSSNPASRISLSVWPSIEIWVRMFHARTHVWGQH